MVTGKSSKVGNSIAISILFVFSLVWMFPIFWTLLQSLRPYGDVLKFGSVSWPHHLNLHNYWTALVQSQMWRYFINSFEVAVPAVVITLFLASMVAFVVSRYSFKFNVALLMLFTAGNLLPPQLVFIPIFRLYIHVWVPNFINGDGVLYNTQLGLILIHVALQMGFATFVLSNYLKTIPKEISESALVDGASVWKHYYVVILPLLRPALASLGVLMTTWIYNDFFWSVALLSSGDKRPITAALSNLQGEFFTDYNLLAAGATLAFIPTLIVFFTLRKQFVSGLTLGSTKG
ncbi:MAG: carbohydrate ABC transporter permease [Actinomycetes bacterium]|jgi:multiple sugar transport system permease protein